MDLGDDQQALHCRMALRRLADDPTQAADQRLAAARLVTRAGLIEPRAEDALWLIALISKLGTVATGPEAMPLAQIELAALHARLGQSIEADKVATAAIESLKTRPQRSEELLRARHYQAAVRSDTVTATEGIALTTAVLNDRIALLGEEHLQTNITRLNLAELTLRSGNAQAAQSLFTTASQLLAQRVGAAHAYTLDARMGAARAAAWRGRQNEANSIVAETLLDARRTRATDDDHVQALEMEQAIGWANGGQLQRARAALQPIAQGLAARHGIDDERTLTAIDRQFEVTYALGDAKGALNFARALLVSRMQHVGATDPRRLNAETRYAAALTLNGQSHEAVARLERMSVLVEPTFDKGDPFYQYLVTELALGYLAQGQVSDAIRAMRQMLAGFVKSDPEIQTINHWLAKQSLANALIETNALDEAADIVEPALQQQRINPDTRRPVLGMLLTSRARLHLARQQPTDALKDVNEAVSVFDAQPQANWREAFAARAVLAQAWSAAGQPDQAIAQRQRLLADVERVRGTLPDSTLVRQAYLREWVPEYKRLALDLARAGQAGEAFRVTELARSRTLVESLTSARADLNGPRSPAHRAQLAELTGQLAVIDETLLEAGDEARLTLEGERLQVAAKLRALRASIAQSDTRYAALLQPPQATPQQAPRLLQRGDVFVGYTVLGDQLLTLSVNARGQVRSHTQTVPLAWRDGIEAWRALLVAESGQGPVPPVWLDGNRISLGPIRPSAQAQRISSAQVLGQRLSAVLLAPLQPVLAGARRLIIAPDPALALLPFDALPWQGQPLINRLELAQVQSFGVLALLDDRRRHLPRGAPSRGLVLGDPAYREIGASIPTPAAAQRNEAEAELRSAGTDADAERGSKTWKRLPGTRVEAQRVAKLFPQAQLLLGADASESAIDQLAQSGALRHFDVLHFATHGLISPQSPWSSALVLAPPAGGAQQDGYLTAARIAQYQLGSRLVVLSACDTASGGALDGEGVLGFPYVLLAAGNAATLLTIWPVNDQSMSQLMPEVMAGVRRGLAPSTALAQAKRRWITTHGAASAHDWAGLVMYGL
jgi:CHAT domain-containing protein/tetratricopeptide (TPR) repeat protein